MSRISLRPFSCLVFIGWLSAACSSDSDAKNPTPAASPEGGTDASALRTTVEGPVTGGATGRPFNALPSPLATQYGYAEAEYFIEGDAASFEPSGTLGTDGVWAAERSTEEHFRTRILVRRPSDGSKFNGTVFVEWLNVSAGTDTDAHFGQAHVEYLRGGYAWVGVSAQAVGVEGGTALVQVPGISIPALKQSDPERYGSLSHPGDDYSYDIFTQAGEVVRHRGKIDVLDGLDVKHVIAAGESQSAFRLVTYVNAVHPLAKTYEGFLIHSRGGGGTPLSTASGPPPAAVFIRTDLDEPVFQFETETDLVLLGFNPARQADTGKIRTWEVAGTAHADRTSIEYGAGGGVAGDAGLDLSSFCSGMNSGPQSYVLRKAVSALTSWVADGTAPTGGDPLEVASGAIVRDDNGNAKGGIRTPAVDAPIAALRGDANADAGLICALFGATIPFDAAKLSSLYPTHADYVNRVKETGDAAVNAGHLLAVDRDLMVAAAEKAAVP